MASPRRSSLSPNQLSLAPNGSSSPSTFTPSPEVAAQAHILQLQAQILQLQAQILLQPSTPPSATTSPLASSQHPTHSHNTHSLSLLQPITPHMSHERRRTLPPRTLPPRSPPPPRPVVARASSPNGSQVRPLAPLPADPSGTRHRACSTPSGQPDPGLLSESASAKNYESRVSEQTQVQQRENIMFTPRSSRDPLPEIPEREESPQPSMSDIAAKLLSVLHGNERSAVSHESRVMPSNVPQASEGRIGASGSDSKMLRGHHLSADSFDDVHSLAGSYQSDDDSSVSSKERHAGDVQPSNLPTLKGGNLMKKRRMRGWSKRYVLLNAAALSYYKGSVLKASLPLTGDSEMRLGQGAEFTVSDGAKTVVHFAAGSETERREWMVAIQEIIDLDKKSKRYETRNGELHMRLWFEEEKFTLHVNVICARGLKRKSKKVNAYNNPYVKLRVLPRQGPACQTRVIKNCVDPIWDESFHLRLERSTLTVQTLHVKVKNDETGLDALFGEIDLPLLNVSFDGREPTDAWLPLQNLNEKKDESVTDRTVEGRPRSHSFGSSLATSSSSSSFPGDISSLSSANYETKSDLLIADDEVSSVGTIRASVWYDTDAEMLQVEVMECRLHKAKQHFVELRILPSESEVQPCKTKVHKDDVFNEKFEMPLSQTRVTFSTLAFAVKDRRTTFGKSKNLGEFVLPLDRIPRTTAAAVQTHRLIAPSSTVFELHTLGDILLVEAGYQSFLLMVEKEYSTENLLFWKEVQDFRYKYLDAFEDQRGNCMSECIEICNKYIDVGSENEINIPPSIKDRIRAQLRDEKQTYSNWCESLACIFDRAQAEVLELMSRDSFARYLASQEWANFSKYLQLDSTERELGFKVTNLIVDFAYVNRAREAMIEQRNTRVTMSRGGDRRLPDTTHRDSLIPGQLRPRLVSTSTFS